ncbi:MAG: exo-beta-N-acetylmuramidase NamZ domain-containing protein [Solirubrobacterales bacterium]
MSKQQMKNAPPQGGKAIPIFGLLGACSARGWVRRGAAFLAASVLTLSLVPVFPAPAKAAVVKLGNEVLLEKDHSLIEGKRVGLVTNQTGVNSQGTSVIDVLAADPSIKLAALYGPEHGIDGKAVAGKSVASYTHSKLKIPVYSLYGATRTPTPAMLKGIDVLVFDVQDIGARSYTFMSTLNYCMAAAKRDGKPIIVLDRPNPVGGLIVDGPVMEDRFISFVGVDNLPMAHGMTAGELARFFNRKIGANLTVVPMEGYSRSMLLQDTGLPWVPTSPRIPDTTSLFGYMATGLGENTGIGQQDNFKWIGGKGVDSVRYAALLNQSGLAGVIFVAEKRGSAGGVRLKITDYHAFNPARTGIYALTYAHQLSRFKVPKSGKTINMFDKIMGTDKIGQYLEAGLGPAEIEVRYAQALNRFRTERKQYLLYPETAAADQPTVIPAAADVAKPTAAGQPGVIPAVTEVTKPTAPIEPKPVGPTAPAMPKLPAAPKGDIIAVTLNGKTLSFDQPPFIDAQGRVMVPLRGIVEALGLKASWNPERKTITISGKAGPDSVFIVGHSAARVKGKMVKMDTSPVIKSGRTLVPVRYIAEASGAEVIWDPIKRTVAVRAK